MPLAVCATPIGNLDDVTLRVLRGARRSRSRALRGHPAHAGAARAPRHQGAAALLPRAQRGERTAELLPRLEAGERVALVWTRACRGSTIPGARLVAAALEVGVPVTVLPGAPRSRQRSSRADWRRSGTSSSASCRAASARWGARRGAGRWPWAAVAFESPQRLPAFSGVLARGDPGAAGRGLPRADEALRGGRARDGGRARREVRRAAEGRGNARARAAAPVAGADEGAATDGGRRAGGGGLPRRQAAEVVSAAHRSRAQPALPHLVVIRFDNDLSALLPLASSFHI